jgi:hypothetical protein
MLSRSLFGELTPLGGIRPSEQVPVPGSTALAGREGPPEQRGVRPGKHCSSGTWGTARAAQRGARLGEHCSSSIGDHAH